MIPAVRHQRILRSLQERDGQTVAALASNLNVSPSTIRRDLSLMEDDGIVLRTFGGAVLPGEGDDPLHEAHQINREAKVAIAGVAKRLVDDNMTVVLDVGSTVLALAEQLRGRPLTIVTASLPVFALFAREPLAHVLLLGGGYRPDYECTAGHMTVTALQDVQADVAFLGCSGVAPDGNIRDNTSDQVPVKRAIIAAAASAVLLADQSKFPGHGTYTIAGATVLSHLVTDAQVRPPLAKTLAASRTEVLYA